MRFLGPHACEEALQRGELHLLRLAPQAWERCVRLREAARSAGVPVRREPLESLDRRAQGQRHQGVLGEGADLELTELEALCAQVRARGDQALVLALDGVTDPHNFGAILRSAAAAGVDGVVFPERRSAQVGFTQREVHNQGIQIPQTGAGGEHASHKSPEGIGVGRVR